MTIRSCPRLLVEDPVGLADAGGQVREVLHHVDRDVAVDLAVREVEPGLAVPGDGLHPGEALPDLRGHVLAELDGVVVGLLLGRQLLVVQVLAEARADLDRRLEAGMRVLAGKLWLNRSTIPKRSAAPGARAS
jgi:hypothetical protein